MKILNSYLTSNNEYCYSNISGKKVMKEEKKEEIKEKTEIMQIKKVNKI